MTAKTIGADELNYTVFDRSGRTELDFPRVRKEIETAIHACCIEQVSLKNWMAVGERPTLVVENTLRDLRVGVSDVLQDEPQTVPPNKDEPLGESHYAVPEKPIP